MVVQDLKPQRSPSHQFVDWIRSSIDSASDTLGIRKVKVPDEVSNTVDQPTVAVRERKILSTPDGPEPVSFPSFLNSGHARPTLYSFRRASLLDGIEQTLDVQVSRRAVLLPPLKETKNKLNRAFKNFINADLLPVPITLPQTTYDATTKTLISLPNRRRTSTDSSPSRQSTTTSFVGLATIFLGACVVIGSVYNTFPQLSEDERIKVKLPRDIEDAKELGRVLSKYKDTNYFEVMSAFFVTYIFLQTFAIPGSVFLSILSGFMYPFYLALPMVCLCSGIGATGCYMISHFVGKPLIRKYLEERVRKWNEVVDSQREHLFNYLLFLRITPFLPNWFINVVSPLIEIPVSTFFLATFLGVAPLSFIAIQGGTTLYQLTTAREAISWTGIIVMAGLAVLSLVPVLVKKSLKEKFS